MTTWIRQSGYNLSSLPPLKSAAAKGATLPGMPRNYKLILDAIPIGRGFDRIIGFLQMHGAIGPEFARALNEEVSLEQDRWPALDPITAQSHRSTVRARRPD